MALRHLFFNLVERCFARVRRTADPLLAPHRKAGRCDSCQPPSPQTKKQLSIDESGLEGEDAHRVVLWPAQSALPLTVLNTWAVQG